MHGGQVLKAVVVCVGLAIAFFAGVPVAKAALIGGAILLLTRAIKPERIYREIDGPLLFMFAGLFVVVAGAEKTLLTPDMIASAKNLGLDDVWRPVRLHRGALQHHEQCPGRAGAAALHTRP